MASLHFLGGGFFYVKNHLSFVIVKRPVQPQFLPKSAKIRPIRVIRVPITPNFQQPTNQNNFDTFAHCNFFPTSTHRKSDTMPAALKTFIIYSAADRELRVALERQLKSLIDNGLVKLWSDKEILPGEHWDAAIKKQLLDAELFLMIISADFFNSDYIREKEFVAALAKLERGEAIIIPIIGRDCDWEAYPEIKKLQVLPPAGIAVTDLDHWKTTDKAWATVTREIRRRIEALHFEQNERERMQILEKQRIESEKAAEQKRLADQLAAEKLAAEQKIIAAEREREENERREFQKIQKKQHDELERQRILDEKRRADEDFAKREFEKNENERRAAAARFAEKQARLENAKPFPIRLAMQIGGLVLGLLLFWFLGKKIFQNNRNQKAETKTEEPQVANKQQKPPGEGRSKSGFQMKSVTGGTFRMGSPTYEKGRNDDECQHQVSVSSFKIGIYEVTQADWFEIMGTRPSIFENCDDCPVERVSWNDIQDFLKKAKAKYGIAYRLPTENEWEFAARGGNFSKKYKFAGGNTLTDVAWCGSNSGSKTQEVGTKTPNELGIFDMSGNVCELCQDIYKPYPCDSKNKADTTARVWRGGAWWLPFGYRSAERNLCALDERQDDVGFRLAQD